jgi:hypothetical protein
MRDDAEPAAVVLAVIASGRRDLEIALDPLDAVERLGNTLRPHLECSVTYGTVEADDAIVDLDLNGLIGEIGVMGQSDLQALLERLIIRWRRRVALVERG